MAIRDQEEQIIDTQTSLHSPNFDMNFEQEDPLYNWNISGDHGK
jgi:hypothetical protein